MTRVMRTAVVAAIGLAIGLGFGFGRPLWDPEMRLWRTFGDAAVMLLLVALAMGPAARLAPPMARLLPWRREFGVWFGLATLVHTLLVLDGWARWDVARFLGYEYVAQLGWFARLEPGFNLANLIGLVAMLTTVSLVRTSTDRAVWALGPSAWKLLQVSSYSVFYLSAVHTGYFLFMHNTALFHRQVPDLQNAFRVPILLLTLGLVVLQAAAFAVRSAGAEASARPPPDIGCCGRPRPWGGPTAVARRPPGADRVAAVWLAVASSQGRHRRWLAEFRGLRARPGGCSFQGAIPWSNG